MVNAVGFSNQMETQELISLVLKVINIVIILSKHIRAALKK